MPSPTRSDRDTLHYSMRRRNRDQDGDEDYEPPRQKDREGHRSSLRDITEGTLDALITGSYVHDDERHLLHIKAAKKATKYYAPDSSLSTWSSKSPLSVSAHTAITFAEITTLKGIRRMAHYAEKHESRVGVLNFACAHRAGGGFMNGAQAQEESIARSSTLFATLYTESAQRFYKTHRDHRGDFFYSHAMIWSPRIQVFRNDEGEWTEPVEVDVVTSAAVNAAQVRLHAQAGEYMEQEIEDMMRERMARILYLFERTRTKVLVLGSFGTGAFQNDAIVVAQIWAELLVGSDARFKHSFDKVLFAINDKNTFESFKDAFENASKRKLKRK
jgi:uncharacterized protein (TIGR02452 family)